MSEKLRSAYSSRLIETATEILRQARQQERTVTQEAYDKAVEVVLYYNGGCHEEYQFPFIHFRSLYEELLAHAQFELAARIVEKFSAHPIFAKVHESSKVTITRALVSAAKELGLNHLCDVPRDHILEAVIQDDSQSSATKNWANELLESLRFFD